MTLIAGASALPRTGSRRGPPDEWLADDARVDLDGRRLEVHPTPGHTRGHVVFADREGGLLFAGDHILPHITPSIGFEPAPGPLPLRSYLRSLQLIRELPDLRLLPAHSPVVPSTHARVDELLDHHGQRLDACLARHDVAGVAHYTSRADPSRPWPFGRREPLLGRSCGATVPW